MLFKASAPGSLMVLGEYAVLHDKYALVLAVNKRMTVTLTPRTDSLIRISSDQFGETTQQLSQLTIVAPFQFILATLKYYQPQLRSGCDIVVKSDFSDQLGFASSAAVTVATLAVLSRWLNVSNDDLQLITLARDIVRSVQGVGSGADVAACVMGGVVAYRAHPLSVEKFSEFCPFTVVYSGSKTKTVDAIAHVKKYFASQPDLYEKICDAISQCAIQGIDCVRQHDWVELGKLMDIQQGLMDALAVNNSRLTQLIYQLRSQKNMLGAKISGSGLGDCVIGLGVASIDSSIELAEQGVICETI